MLRLVGASAAVLALSPAPARATDLDLAPRWRPEWARFDLPNLLLTGGAGATALTFTLAVGPPSRGWKDDWLFDAALRDALRADDPRTRQTLSDVSDVLQLGFALYPLVVDAALVAGWVHDDPRLGAELALIGVETLLVAAVPVAVTKAVVGRVRPEGEPCGAPDDYSCRTRATRQSFLSGHTTVAFASAGLTCANHLHLDLYGGGVADAAACAGAVGVATTTGLLRVAAGRHYATDVAAGAIVGFAVGYLVPTLLHYSAWGPMSGEVGVVPAPLAEGTGLALTGWF